jgi:two-component system, OmpR family, response regulator
MLKKVYIIDDEKDFCQLLKNYLQKKNYEVEVYYLLQDGMKALADNPSGIVFLDNNLPDGLGWEKITELNDNYPELMLHLLSGYHYTNAALHAGNHIKMWQKPISFVDLDKYFK